MNKNPLPKNHFKTTITPLTLLLIIFMLLSYNNTASAVKFKISALSPDGSTWIKKLKQGAKEIKQKTHGRVSFKFYPGGVMGRDKTILKKIKIGQLQGAVFSNGTINKLYSGSQVYNLVLKFNSYEEIDYIRPKIDPMIKVGMHKNGYTLLGLSELGFAYLMSKTPIENIDDLKKQKAWIPEDNYTAAEAMKAFSVSPIPLPLQDVLVALQTDMINVVAGSPVGAITLHWHTKIGYVTDLPIAYVYGGLVLSNRAMQKISGQDQLIVKEVMQRVTHDLDTIARKNNKQAIEALKNQGIKWIEPEKGTAAKLKALISSTNKKLIESTHMDKKIVRALDDYLAEFRINRQAINN